MNIDEGYCRWALYHPPLWRCHSTDASRQSLIEGRPTYTGDIVGGTPHPPLWRFVTARKQSRQ